MNQHKKKNPTYYYWQTSYYQIISSYICEQKHYRNHMNIQENPYQEMETILTLNEQQFQHVPILHGIWLSNEWFYCILEDCGIDLYEYTKQFVIFNTN